MDKKVKKDLSDEGNKFTIGELVRVSAGKHRGMILNIVGIDEEGVLCGMGGIGVKRFDFDGVRPIPRGFFSNKK